MKYEVIFQVLDKERFSVIRYGTNEGTVRREAYFNHDIHGIISSFPVKYEIQILKKKYLL